MRSYSLYAGTGYEIFVRQTPMKAVRADLDISAAQQVGLVFMTTVALK